MTGETLKFVVLSDLHLRARGMAVNGLDTGERLSAAVETINRDHGDAAFVLVAGDLADLGEVAAYRHLAERLAPLNLPVHITVGNHDDRAAFTEVFGADRDDPQGRVSLVLDAGGYRVILLDTTEPGRHGGKLCEGRKAWLAARLDEVPNRPVIVVQHHHAHPLSLPVDDIALEDGEGYAAILHRHADVRQVIAGHVHIATSAVWRGIPMTTMAGSHYSVGPHLPGMAGAQRRLEGPAQMAVVLADAAGVVVHFHDYLDRHLTLADGLFAAE